MATGNPNQMVEAIVVQDDVKPNPNMIKKRTVLFTEDGTPVNMTDLVGLLGRVQALEDA